MFLDLLAKAMTRLIIQRSDDNRTSTSLKTVAVLGCFLQMLFCIGSGKKKTRPTGAQKYCTKGRPPPPSKLRTVCKKIVNWFGSKNKIEVPEKESASPEFSNLKVGKKEARTDICSKVLSKSPPATTIEIENGVQEIVNKFGSKNDIDVSEEESASPEFYYLKVGKSIRHLSYEAIMKVLQDNITKQSGKIDVNEKGKTSHTSERKTSSDLRDSQLEAVQKSKESVVIDAAFPLVMYNSEKSEKNERLSKVPSITETKELTRPSEHLLNPQDNRVKVDLEELSIQSKTETKESLNIDDTTASGSKASLQVSDVNEDPSHIPEEMIRDVEISIIRELADFNCVFQDLKKKSNRKPTSM